MSTVLTNGIIIPDNGSRNWGGDLANNWNIIDVNVGYMNDVKNRVATLENSVAENTANIQTNTSNISALQTSKQDVIEDLETIRAGASAGATAVQPNALNNYYTKTEVDTTLSGKANDDAVVHKSGDEVISGVKKFSDEVQTNTITAVSSFQLVAQDKSSTNFKTLSGNSDGSLTWSTNSVLTDANQIILAKNLTGTDITPGAVVDCGNGNGKLEQWYLDENGTLKLAVIPAPSGVWKSASFITISPNHSTIFIKLN